MLRFLKLSILLNKISSLDLQGIAVVRAKMCTDTPLVPARLHPPICLVVPAWHPPCACLRRRTVTLSSLQQGLVVRVDNVHAILHDGRERDFSPVVQCGV
jgi:hypothetical protein